MQGWVRIYLCKFKQLGGTQKQRTKKGTAQLRKREVGNCSTPFIFLELISPPSFPKKFAAEEAKGRKGRKKREYLCCKKACFSVITRWSSVWGHNILDVISTSRACFHLLKWGGCVWFLLSLPPSRSSCSPSRYISWHSRESSDLQGCFLFGRYKWCK